LVSPQPVGRHVVADVRYLQPATVGLVLLTACALEALSRRAWPGIALALVLSYTNAVHRLFDRLFRAPDVPELRSTLLAYLGELRRPPGSAYGFAAWFVNHEV